MERVFLVSVIIPVYNGERYIEQTIQSLLKQPCKDVEILIINDGSTDNSAMICQRMAEQSSQIKYYEKENEGIGATRNYGIKRATGCYLAFLDQDDIWVKDFLDEALISNISRGDSEVFAFSYYRANANFSRANAQCVDVKVIEGGGVSSANSTWQHHSSMLFKRTMVLEHHLFYPQTRHEDEIFRHMCLYVANKVTFIDKMMFLYRNNITSETHRAQSPEKLYLPILDSWLTLAKWYKEKYPNDKSIIPCVERIYCNLAIEAIESLYQSWIRNKRISDILNQINFEILDNYKSLFDAGDTKERIFVYYEHFYGFVIRNRLIGLRDTMFRKLFRYSPFRDFLDARRYPIIIENNRI